MLVHRKCFIKIVAKVKCIIIKSFIVKWFVYQLKCFFLNCLMKVLRLILLIWGIFIFLFISIWHIADSVVFVFFWQKPFLDFKRLILFKLRNSMFQYLLYHLVVLVTVGWEVTMGSSRLTRFHIRDRVWRGGWKWRVLTSKCSHGQAIFVTCDIIILRVLCNTNAY